MEKTATNGGVDKICIELDNICRSLPFIYEPMLHEKGRGIFFIRKNKCFCSPLSIPSRMASLLQRKKRLNMKTRVRKGSNQKYNVAPFFTA
jgi:hypothetical protein